MTAPPRAILCAAVLSALAFAAPAAGKDGGFLDLLDQENKVFAASRYVQTLAQTPANVTIISRDDIVRFGYRNVAEALYAVPGFYNAASQWPALGLRGVAVPGDFGSRVLYMVNGMPLYEPTYGAFFLEYLDIASIERIEVVRGSGSALYGSGAVMGIINLITRNGHDAPGQTAIVGAGSHGSTKLYGAHAGVTGGGTDVFASISRTGGRGRDIYLSEFGGTSAGNDDEQTWRAFLRLGKGNLWAQVLAVDGNRRDPLASYGTVFNTDKLVLRERFIAAEAGANHELASGARLTGRLYAFDVAERGDYPYRNDGLRIGAPDYINVTDIGSHTVGAELRYDHFVTARHHILAGVEIKRVSARHEIGDQPGMARAGVVNSVGTPSYSQYSAFLQDEWRLNENQTLFIGARFDAYNGISRREKSRLSPRIAYVVDLGAGHTGKLIYGEAFRAPTVYESLYSDLTATGYVTLWRNPNLRPEVTRTLEAVWERELRRGVGYSVSAYATQLRNTPRQVVVNAFEGIPCPILDGCNQYQDSGTKMQVLGIEAAARWKRADGMAAYASATLQRGTERPGGSALASSPRYLLKGGVSYPDLIGNWRGNAELHVVGATQGLASAGARTAGAPAYAIVNAGLGNDRIAPGWSATLRIHNLFDRQTYSIASNELWPVERIPAPGRTLWLQLRKDL